MEVKEESISTSIKDIEERLKRVEEEEVRIEEEEQKILTADRQIISSIEKTQKTSLFISFIYRFRFILSVLVTIGIVLVWKGIGGISDNFPIVSTAIGALVVGVLILFSINLITKIGK